MFMCYYRLLVLWLGPGAMYQCSCWLICLVMVLVMFVMLLFTVVIYGYYCVLVLEPEAQ